MAGTPEDLAHGERTELKARARLVAVKTLHTAIWVVLAARVLAIPVAACARNFAAAVALIGVVGVETLVLASNGWRCPLQSVAARYTQDRSGNFDIYLPAWFASRTIIVFDPLFGFGIMTTGLAWLA